MKPLVCSSLRVDSCFLRTAFAIAVITVLVPGVTSVFASKHQSTSTATPASKRQTESKSVVLKSGPRTLHFSSQYPVGVLRVIPTMREVNVHSEDEVIAKGDVTIDVPAGKYLLLELIGNVVNHPESLDGLANAPIDILLVKNMLSMREAATETSSADKLTSRISKISNLRKVSFIRCDITDSGAARLAVLPNLTSVTFDVCAETTGRCFKQLAKCPGLTEIHLGVSAGADKDSFQYLSQMFNLEGLHLNSTGLNETGTMWIGKCHNLRELDVRKNSAFDDKCLAYLVALKKLETLDITQTSVTISGLMQLKTLHLEKLWLSDHFAHDMARFQEFKKALPGTTVLLIKPSKPNTKDITRWYEDRSYRGPSRL